MQDCHPVECITGGSLRKQLHLYQCPLAQTQLMHYSSSVQRQLPGRSSLTTLLQSVCSLNLWKGFSAEQVILLQVAAAASAATDAPSQADSGAESCPGYCLALACPDALHPGTQHTILFCLFAYSDYLRYACFLQGSHDQRAQAAMTLALQPAPANTRECLPSKSMHGCLTTSCTMFLSVAVTSWL